MLTVTSIGKYTSWYFCGNALGNNLYRADSTEIY